MDDTTPPQTPDPAGKKKRQLFRRPVAWILTISLTLNFLFVGALVGVGLSHKQSNPRFGEDAGYLIRALPQEMRRDLARKMRRSLDRDMGIGRRNLSVDVLAVAEILESEPFNAAALEQHFIEQSARTGKIHQVANRELVDQISVLTPAQRAEMAQRLREQLSEKSNRYKDRQRP